MTEPLCKNCGHAKSLHFKWNAYVPGKCDFQYDLCSCRNYEPSTTTREGSGE